MLLYRSKPPVYNRLFSGKLSKDPWELFLCRPDYSSAFVFKGATKSVGVIFHRRLVPSIVYPNEKRVFAIHIGEESSERLKPRRSQIVNQDEDLILIGIVSRSVQEALF